MSLAGEMRNALKTFIIESLELSPDARGTAQSRRRSTAHRMHKCLFSSHPHLQRLVRSEHHDKNSFTTNASDHRRPLVGVGNATLIIDVPTLLRQQELCIATGEIKFKHPQ